jgi:hypothetical protein
MPGVSPGFLHGDSCSRGAIAVSCILFLPHFLSVAFSMRNAAAIARLSIDDAVIVPAAPR